MFNDNVVKLIQPGILTDRLTEVLRDGARALLTQAVEAEVSEFLAATADLKTDSCLRIVRHGHLPERRDHAGIGPVAERQPRVRDGEAGYDDPARIRFTPAILPPYARRSKSLDTLIPILYLKGVRGLRRDLCGQVREGRRMPEEGPEPAAGLLRLPGRTLETPAHVEPDRKHLRNRPT